MSNLLFSIIVPVYNVEDYLEHCLNSVIEQSFQNFELIVVNDGSTDSSPTICEKYALQDDRVKVIHKKNGGSSEARNVGVLASIGTYLLFIDSDDYWEDKNFLLSISTVIERDPKLDIINFGWVKYFPARDKFVPEKRNFSASPLTDEKQIQYINRLIKKDLYIASAWNKCIKRTFVVDNNISFKNGLKSEDMDWCGQLLFHMPDMTCLDTNSYIYRQERAGSITSNVDKKHLEDIIQMIQLAIVDSQKLHSLEKRNYLSFYAVQYLTLLFNLNVLSRQDDPQLFKEVFELRNILNNDLNYKVKIANTFRNLFGFAVMIRLLRLYVLFIKK